MITISSIDDPRISFYRSLRYTPPSHIENRVFIAEGAKLVLRLLESNLKIHSIFAVAEFIENNYTVISSRLKNPNEQLYSASIKLMEQIVGFPLHSGVMAIAYQPDDCPLEQMSNAIIALNSINNPDNVGLIARTMKAFNIDSLLVDEHSSSPFLRRAVRVSMGNIFDLKVHHSQKLNDSLLSLKKKSYSIITAEICENSVLLPNLSFPEKFVLVFGNEGNGVEKWILEKSDYIVKIPMNPLVQSLNVAISAGIILYEYSKNK